jgi:protein O-mannosyl-transferase
MTGVVTRLDERDPTQTANRFRGKSRWILIAGLIALVFAAHFPALQAGFVWDDTALVLRDPLIRSPRLIPEGFQHFLFTDATVSNFYRPLQRLSYTAEYIAFGFRTHSYHFDNICLHALATIALLVFALAFLSLYWLEKRKALWIATIAVAAWTLHPLHSGVVDYVSGRADSLAALFGFTALYFAIQALRQTGSEGIPAAGNGRQPQRAAQASWKFHALAALALIASALSKESGLIFGAIYLALIVLQRNWRALIPASIALTFVGTIYFTLRSQVPSLEVPQLTPPAPALVRPIIAARALAEYAGLLIAPVNLHMDRDVETRPWGLSEASLNAAAGRELETVAGVALAGALLFWLVRARQCEVFALLIFAGLAYLAVCGLFRLNATMAEHWIYVPAAFLFLAGAVQLSSLLRTKKVPYFAIASASIWIAFLGVRSFYRARDWKDERTFFHNTIGAGGDSARMLINLAVLEMNESSGPERRHLDKAQELLQRALAKEPEQPFALLNLAAMALKRNDFPAARAFLNRAKTHPVTEAQAYEMMAVLEFKESSRVNLLRLRLASRTGAPSWPIAQRYIRALNESGQTKAAIAELRVVLATEEYRAETWALLSQYLAKLGYAKEAGETLAEAHRLDVRLNEH